MDQELADAVAYAPKYFLGVGVKVGCIHLSGDS